jgi:hypothetical protein
VGQDAKRYTSRPQTGRPAPASELADRFHKTLGAEEFPARLMNSLFCRKNSLFLQKNSLFFWAQGICCNAMKLLGELT